MQGYYNIAFVVVFDKNWTRSFQNFCLVNCFHTQKCLRTPSSVMQSFENTTKTWVKIN